MTQFLFNMFNHSKKGQSSLEDVIGIMGHQMRALGHEAVWETNNARFVERSLGYNVVVEGFTPSVIELIRRAHEQGCRFICLATEEPTAKGFNHGTDREMRMRQETFPDAAKYFDGILYLVPGGHVGDWYGQFCPAAYAELGYAPTFERKQVIEPTYDFGFFGSLTKRRHSILKRLANRCNPTLLGNPRAIKLVTDFPDQIKRDNAIQEARVVVQLRKTDEMGLVSSSRCNTSLMCGRPIVAEPHDRKLSKPWDEIVRFTDTMEEFYATCMAVRACWRSVHAAQYDKFKTLLTPWKCIGAPLLHLGIESPKAPADAVRVAA